jgi:hypothetical protein
MKKMFFWTVVSIAAIIAYLVILKAINQFTFQNITWIFTAGSIMGAFAVASLKKWGMVVWLFANMGWCIYNLTIWQYSQVAIFLFFIISNIYGLYRWQKSNITN